ncbi:MAG TPA: hypothetical protein VLJ21_02325 [Candidatus Binatia bacterium]|nr:hypothetical protein [Candidatus Binatia bacterium]
MKKKDFVTEEEIEGADLYFETSLADLADDDVISSGEEGFMLGYLTAF